MYAGGAFLTGDEIADALMDLAAALAEASLAEPVEIPVLGPDGARITSSFLVGPASQIVTEVADWDGEELVDAETVERLRVLTRATRPVAALADDEAPAAAAGWDDGFSTTA